MTPRVSKLSAAALWILILTFVGGCQPVEEREGATDLQSEAADGFQYEAERFADLRVLRFQVPGFDQLDLQKKKLVYYLYEAALAGREIIYDQKHHMNLAIKRTLEEIYRHYPGDRETPAFQAYVTYLKRIWFANGIHHHYSSDKFAPGFSFDDLNGWVQATIQSEESSAAAFPTREGQTVDQLLAELRPVMFDASVDAKLVNKEKGSDLVAGSAVNFYTGVTQKEVEAFYKERMDSKDPRPISWGLNSTLVKKDDGSLAEVVWKVGGKYTGALKPVADWIEKAAGVAENAKQKKALEKLAVYFRSGSLKDWDDYNIAWVQDVDSDVDVINGFIEVYNDSMGYRGSFESVVSVRDPIATKRIEAIAKKAQWFEDNSPLIESHKKKEVTGITARVINVVVESGDCSPTSPIGINLPNANWIRKEHGSKSVNLANIVNSYNQVAGASLDEFCWDAAEANRAREHGELADMLHTDMHEVIGHASGQINEGVGTPKQTLKNYSSTLEEARADLVALYYMIDPKLIELGLMESLVVGRTAYDDYMRNGLMTQLRRIKKGHDIEEDHMRNRQLVAKWVYERAAKTGAMERTTRDGKTFFVIQDYDRLRVLFGELLREIQRIKSEGDFESGESLVETYGVKVDQDLHTEVLERYSKLDIPAYSGFINPRLVPVIEDGEIRDVKIEYPDNFAGQMLEYAEKYSSLPAWN